MNDYNINKTKAKNGSKPFKTLVNGGGGGGTNHSLLKSDYDQNHTYK